MMYNHSYDGIIITQCDYVASISRALTAQETHLTLKLFAFLFVDGFLWFFLPRTFHQPSTNLPLTFHQPSTNLQLRFVGIARLVSSFRLRGDIYLLLEYAARGDLHSLICYTPSRRQPIVRGRVNYSPVTSSTQARGDLHSLIRRVGSLAPANAAFLFAEECFTSSTLPRHFLDTS